jgi:superfamily I DNA/RNA helicase
LSHVTGLLEHAAGLHAQEVAPDPERLAGERRLFYVATTRAKDRLLITHVAERGRRPTGGPSRFLAEAGFHQTPSSPAP